MSGAYILDTEWTDRDAPQVIEAAWIAMPKADDLFGASDRINVHELAPYRTFEERYKPSKPISFGAMAVHHILPSELEHAPPHSEFCLPQDVVYLIGHSVDGDWKVAGSLFHVKRICTYGIAQHLFDECDSKSLVSLLYYTGGANSMTRQRVKDAHGAMQDCWNTLQLLRVILERKPEIDTWSQLWEYSEQCRPPLRMPHGDRRGALISDLDTSEINWYLRKDFIDPYLRIAMERVIEARYPKPVPAPQPQQSAVTSNGDDEDYDMPF